MQCPYVCPSCCCVVNLVDLQEIRDHCDMSVCVPFFMDFFGNSKCEPCSKRRWFHRTSRCHVQVEDVYNLRGIKDNDIMKANASGWYNSYKFDSLELKWSYFILYDLYPCLLFECWHWCILRRNSSGWLHIPTATSFIMIPLLCCWVLRAGNRQKVRALLGVQGLYPASSPGCGKAVVPTRVGRNRNLCNIFTSQYSIRYKSHGCQDLHIRRILPWIESG